MTKTTSCNISSKVSRKRGTIEPLLMDKYKMRTPSHYVQITRSERNKNSYKLYLCNMDTFIIPTLSPVPLVSILKRFDCIHKAGCNHLFSVLKLSCNIYYMYFFLSKTDIYKMCSGIFEHCYICKLLQ